MMKQLIAETGRDNTLLLNSGNAFEKVGELELQRAAVILQAFSMIGYEVYAPGPFDAVFGLPEFGRLASGQSYPLVCANLAKEAGAEMLDHQVFSKAGQKILVTGIVDPWLAQVKEEKMKMVFPVVEPAEKLKQLFDTVPHDLSILVVQTAYSHLEQLLASLPVVPDVVVLGYFEGVFPPKKLANGSLLVGNNKKGKILCAVDLVKGAEGWQAADWKHETLLKTTVVPEPQLDVLISQQEEREKVYLQNKAKKEAATSRRPDRNFFLGADWCVRCHTDISKRWKETRHARAMASLQKDGRQDDPRCQPCHVTGMPPEDSQQTGLQKGFSSLRETPYLVNVQCEACHGPGKMHARKPKENPMLHANEQVCRTCHTEETSPDFRYDPALVH